MFQGTTLKVVYSGSPKNIFEFKKNLFRKNNDFVEFKEFNVYLIHRKEQREFRGYFAHL